MTNEIAKLGGAINLKAREYLEKVTLEAEPMLPYASRQERNKAIPLIYGFLLGCKTSVSPLDLEQLFKACKDEAGTYRRAVAKYILGLDPE